jgi:predicted nucleic acid-binding protein
MILPDVNVLVYAHREDAVDHPRYRQWLEEIIQSGQPYGISDHVLSGFLRVVTHPRVFTTPARLPPRWISRGRFVSSRIARSSRRVPATGKFSPACANRFRPRAT